jgi:hypothetical protein
MDKTEVKRKMEHIKTEFDRRTVYVIRVAVPRGKEEKMARLETALKAERFEPETEMIGLAHGEIHGDGVDLSPVEVPAGSAGPCTLYCLPVTDFVAKMDQAEGKLTYGTYSAKGLLERVKHLFSKSAVGEGLGLAGAYTSRVAIVRKVGEPIEFMDALY